MAKHGSDYLIIGGGLAGASAVEGIREHDQSGSITIVGAENHLPYDRPPLSKKLWFGKAEVKDIFLHDEAFYDGNGVTLLTGRRVVALDLKNRTVSDNRGESHGFRKLLLATGGTPRVLSIPGGELNGLLYYRTVDDYQKAREAAAEGKSAVVIGGGFIGSEVAAALSMNHVKVIMIYPSAYLCDRVFPKDLGLAMETRYQSRGITILKGQKPVAIERKDSRFLVRTSAGEEARADLIIIGIGINPRVELAEQAGLSTHDGIIVNEYLQTSHPDIYAAGDNARFPYQALGQQTRVEHWDNALNQGKHAGKNMAGAYEPFSYMPYFFSDLFEFGYEAVGEVSSQLKTVAEWEKQHDTGTIYYLRDGKIRGAMMCNVWDKVDEARDLIRRAVGVSERVI
ncbi:MAG: NAD(P)/FAD-dependent oxidoreductase [Acidobacteriota bacterium]